jgi:hypothetical protein
MCQIALSTCMRVVVPCDLGICELEHFSLGGTLSQYTSTHSHTSTHSQYQVLQPLHYLQLPIEVANHKHALSDIEPPYKVQHLMLYVMLIMYIRG